MIAKSKRVWADAGGYEIPDGCEITLEFEEAAMKELLGSKGRAEQRAAEERLLCLIDSKLRDLLTRTPEEARERGATLAA